MDIGILSIGVSADGAMLGFLKNSTNTFMMRVNSRHFLLIQRLCVPIRVQRVPRKKNGGQDSEALGRSRGGFTTKLHAAVNDKFTPLRFILTAGERHDVTQAPALIAGYTCEYVIADAGYDSDALRATIVEQGAVAVIRPRKNRVEDRPYDKLMIKRCIRIATL